MCKKSNDNKSNSNNRGIIMIYLIVRKRKNDYSEDYRIDKWTRDKDEANKFLSALSLLESDEDVSFYIVASEFAPLVLRNEVA